MHSCRLFGYSYFSVDRSSDEGFGGSARKAFIYGVYNDKIVDLILKYKWRKVQERLLNVLRTGNKVQRWWQLIRRGNAEIVVPCFIELQKPPIRT